MGTGFLAAYKGSRYLVTNQHIALEIGDSPFAVRINRVAVGSDNLLIDPLIDEIKWHSGYSPDVDLAVMLYNYDLQGEGLDAKLVPESTLAGANKLVENDIGIGDLCYAVGLSRLLEGKTRNLPVVHSGNIALMPGEEKIPVKDWMEPNYTTKNRYVNGYLVEATNLRGLSGCPVFVRPHLTCII